PSQPSSTARKWLCHRHQLELLPLNEIFKVSTGRVEDLCPLVQFLLTFCPGGKGLSVPLHTGVLLEAAIRISEIKASPSSRPRFHHMLPAAAAIWELVRNADAQAPPSSTDSESASS
ncbi:unnamed protein product, partial [Gulo gulo]